MSDLVIVGNSRYTVCHLRLVNYSFSTSVFHLHFLSTLSIRYTLTLFCCSGYHFDTPLPFSLYSRHGFWFGLEKFSRIGLSSPTMNNNFSSKQRLENKYCLGKMNPLPNENSFEIFYLMSYVIHQ